MEPRDPPDVWCVTGAAGWLGRALVERLAAERPVLALVRDQDEAAAMSTAMSTGTGMSTGTSTGSATGPPVGDVRVVVADVTRPENLDRALARRSVGSGRVVDLVHTAGVIHPRRVADFHAVNAAGTANVVAAARHAEVRRLVHVSSNSPFGTNPTPRDTFGEHEPYHPYLGYGRSKMAAEEHVAAATAAGLDAVVVRPPWFYGPWQPARQTAFFSMVRAGRFPILGDGEQRRSMVYVENLVDGVVAAALAPAATGRGYWIADAVPYRLVDVVDAVRAALTDAGLDCRPRTLQLPAAVGRVAEVADRALQRVGRYQQQLHVLGELRHTIAVDISAARRDLGYEPRVALLDGMRASVEWCLRQGYEL